jgi:NAD+ kinase
MTDQRRLLLLAHPGRAPARDVACQLVDALSGQDIEVRMLPEEAAALGVSDNRGVAVAGEGDPSADCELLVVIGGDGTILRAAELAHDSGTPILGVNLGHVGFLAEAEYDDVSATIDAIVDRRYTAEDRLTIDVSVFRNACWKSWSRWTGGRCHGGGATAWCVPRRPARRHTTSAPEVPWCGPGWRHC